MPLIQSDVEGANEHEKSCNTAVNLVDSYQTILDCVGLTSLPEEAELPDTSLYDLESSVNLEVAMAIDEYFTDLVMNDRVMIIFKDRVKF